MDNVIDAAVDWRAQWIWAPGSSALPNAYVSARREFHLSQGATHAVLHIAAKERYWLYVNGDYVADGPPNCHPRWQYFDTHEITERLRAGTNVLAMLCYNGAIPTHARVGGPGGLLAQLHITEPGNDQSVIGTDAQWQCALTDWYRNTTPRIRFTLGFQQHVDLRREPIGWTELGFAAADWPQTEVLGPAIHGQWENLIPRDISPLRRVPIRPKSVVGCGTLEHPDGMSFGAFDSIFSPNEAHTGYALTHVHCPMALEACLEVESDDAFKVWVNGALVHERHGHRLGRHHPRESKVLNLNRGWNRLLLKVEQQPSAAGFWVRITDGDNNPIQGIQFASDPERPDAGAWRLVGPFPGERHNLIEAVPERSLGPEYEPGPQWDIEHVSPDLYDAAALTWHSIFHQPEFVDPAALATWGVHRDGRCKVKGLQHLVDGSSPARVDPSGQDVFITFDFGRDHAGHVYFQIDSPEGTIADLAYDEALDDAGHVDCERMSDMRYADRVILREGRQRWQGTEPRTFRYLQLTLRDFSDPVRIHEIGIIETTCPMPFEADFKTSSDLLNRIFQVGLNTLRPCMQEEHHDGWREITQYAGDGYVAALGAFYAHGELALGRKAIYQFARAQRDDGLLYCRHPTGAAQYALDENISVIFWLWHHFLFSGDGDMLAELYPMVSRFLSWLESRTDDYGLLCNVGEGPGHLFIDHELHPDAQRGEGTVINAYYHGALRAAVKIATAIDRSADVDRYRKMAAQVKQSINERLFVEGYYAESRIDGEMSRVRSLHANVAAVYFDVADQRLSPEKFIGMFGRPDFVQPSSGYFHHLSLEALLKLGLERQFITLIRSYWGGMISRGATSWWEEFVPERSLDTGSMDGRIVDRVPRSHCHAYSGAPTYYLPREVLGITPIEPAFRRLLIAPRVFDITSASGSVPTPHGPVRVSWLYDASFRLDVELPQECEATVNLPSFAFPVDRIICNEIPVNPDDIRITGPGRYAIVAK